MKEKYIKLLRETERKGMDDLINYLENETDFFKAPASTKYHLNKEGGLVEHSLNVYYELYLETPDNFDNNSLIIVSLLHDLCKANFYSVSEKNVNKNGKWMKEPYYMINDLYPMGHGEKSLIIAQKYIDLTDEEMFAIRWHMGFSESKENYNYINKAFSKYPLSLYLHIADLKATYIDEV